MSEIPLTPFDPAAQAFVRWQNRTSYTETIFAENPPSQAPLRLGEDPEEGDAPHG